MLKLIEDIPLFSDFSSCLGCTLLSFFLHAPNEIRQIRNFSLDLNLDFV